MSEKWTPGPWEVCNLTDVFTRLGGASRDGVLASLSDGWQICDCHVGLTTSDDGVDGSLVFREQKANANLIAASPELYEALENVYSYMDQPGSLTFEIPSKAMYQVWQALKKARGEL